MRRRPTLRWWVSAVAALLAAACDQGSGAKSRALTSIKVVIADYSKDHTRPFWQSLSEAYTKQTGIKVDLQVVDWNSIDQQVTTMIQNNQPPDVLNLNAFSSYAKDGLLHSADEVLSPRTREDFLPAFVRGGEYQGKLYGFPILSSARAFFYNRDLLARAGVAAPPRTWDELVTAARRVRALGADTIGYALPLGPEEAQVNPGKTNPTDCAFQLFTDGKVGMFMGFSPLAKQLDADGKIRYAVAEMPTNIGTAVTLAVEDYLMAFKMPGNADAVKTFLDLYYQPETITRWIRAEGFLPVTRSGLEQMRADPGLTPYLDALPSAKLAPTTDPAWDKVKLDVQPGGNPKQVLDRLQQNAAAAGGR